MRCARSQRARGEDPGLVDVLLDADTARRAAISAADNLRAEQKTVSKQVGAASPDERPAILERAKQLAADVKAAEAEQANAEEALTAAHMAISNVIDRRRAPRRRGRLRGAGHRRLPARQIDNPKDHVATGRVARPVRHGARREGVGLAVLLPHRRGALLQLGLLQSAVRLAVDNGFTLDDPAGAGSPRNHVGHWVFGCPRRRGVPGRRRRPLSRRHLGGAAGRLPRGRDTRPLRRPAALRGLVVLLSPGGRQLRQGHPRHHSRAPIRQG